MIFVCRAAMSVSWGGWGKGEEVSLKREGRWELSKRSTRAQHVLNQSVPICPASRLYVEISLRVFCCGFHVFAKSPKNRNQNKTTKTFPTFFKVSRPPYSLFNQCAARATSDTTTAPTRAGLSWSLARTPGSPRKPTCARARTRRLRGLRTLALQPARSLAADTASARLLMQPPRPVLARTPLCTHPDAAVATCTRALQPARSLTADTASARLLMQPPQPVLARTPLCTHPDAAVATRAHLLVLRTATGAHYEPREGVASLPASYKGLITPAAQALHPCCLRATMPLELSAPRG